MANPQGSMMTLAFGTLLSLTLSLQLGCSKPQSVGASAPPEAPASESYSAYLANPEASSMNAGERRLSRFFLVEQPSAGVSKALLEAFRRDPPGGLVFWNSSGVGAKELARTVSTYSNILKANAHLPSLFSIDDEGGGLTMSPSGRSIPGIQRFREGFTDLAHGIWLGRAMKAYGTELCELHGRILGKELAAVGVNYPLTLVSDLAMRLFTVRGVSSNPRDVAACLSAFTKSMAEAGPVVAVTKHFPGLGQNKGDTHDVVSVSVASTTEESERHLSTFRELVSFVNQHGLENRLSIMSSHGKFPLFDADHLTTESPALLQGVLRDRLQFKGIRVSDAMWMGGYGTLPNDELYAVYLNAFISGMDMLMIPGNRYGGALRAFTQAAEGRVTPSFRLAIEARTELSFQAFQRRFAERSDESLARIDATLKSLPYPHETISSATPNSLTVRERSRYYEILKSLDSRWAAQLPVSIAQGSN